MSEAREGRQTPQPPQPDHLLERSMGLPSGIALVVGGVIGAGIFVLVRDVTVLVGGAIWLAFAVAITVSLIGVLPLVHIAGALPRAGAGYVFTSRLIHPFLGAVTSWWILLGGGCSSIVATLTLAVYVNEYLPFSPPLPWTGAAILLALYGLYWFGLRMAMSLQVLLMGQFVLALVLYVIWGAARLDIQMALFPEDGLTPFLLGVLLCYSTCMGFQVVAEMGEEMRAARRNIPRSLLIGGAIVALLYMALGAVFVSSAPADPEGLRTMGAPLSQSARAFMPPILVAFLQAAAITAGLTSLNAAVAALPRELFAQGRDGLAPEWLGRVSPRTGAPQNAVTTYFLFALALLGLGGALRWSVEIYAYAAAIGILVMTAVLCVASLQLEKRFPEAGKHAYISFPRPLLFACTVFTVLVCLGFGAALVAERPVVLLLYALWTPAAAAFAAWRLRGLPPAKRDALCTMPGTDERNMGNPSQP